MGYKGKNPCCGRERPHEASGAGSAAKKRVGNGFPPEKLHGGYYYAYSAQHHGDGRIEAIDLSHASLTIAHGPIDSLRWPAMTMDFQVNDAQLLQSLKPGQDIHFAMTENSAGEFVIVQIHPALSMNKR